MTQTSQETKKDCGSWKPIRLRAPKADGETLISPEINQVGKLLQENQSIFQNAKSQLSNRTLQELRTHTRKEAIAAGFQYTNSLWKLAHPNDDSKGFLPDTFNAENPSLEMIQEFAESTPLIMTGHQPEMYHPGVWLKNFAISDMANQWEGLSMNLIVDNDTIKHSSISVPAGSLQNPSVDKISLGGLSVQLPWEEATVNDEDSFQKFGTRISSAMENWGIIPVIHKFWPMVSKATKSTKKFVDLLTVGRKQVEWQWGVKNLELPISKMCELKSFDCFMHHILSNLDSFVKTHNEILKQYRELNRIHSQSHPVPELKINDDWLESPFWVWKEGETIRNPLFVKTTGEGMELSNGQESVGTIPIDCEISCQTVLDRYDSLRKAGWKIRTRALTTTLFTRLLLCDLFIHGIGGAKYDEMADQILCEFFDVKPPNFVVATGTQHLPLGQEIEATPKSLRKLKAKLRDVKFNPERHFEGNSTAAIYKLISAKEKLVEESDSRDRSGTKKVRQSRAAENKARHEMINMIREQLVLKAKPVIQEIEAEIEKQSKAIETARILNSRERSFCLFPEEKLQSFFTSIKTSL